MPPRSSAMLGACCSFRMKGGRAWSGMMTFTDLASVLFDPPGPFTDWLRLAVAAYLARFKGTSREHTESDRRCYLAWCAEHGRVLPDLCPRRRPGALARRADLNIYTSPS
jgi:hypothetical protein